MAAISQTMFLDAFSGMKKKNCVSIPISVKYVPDGLVDNIPAFV